MALLLVALPVFAGNEKLIGTWKSNKDATVAYLKTHTQLSPKQLEVLGKVLGKMTITFDKNTLTEKSGDWQFSTPYKIISETANSITIESNDPQTKKPTKSVFEFDGNSFWSPEDKIPGYKERFDKLTVK